MTKQKINYVPVLTSAAGSCLTAKNWVEAGVTLVSCHLSSLVIKPGLPYLKTLPNLASYIGWEGSFLLNASMPARASEGTYALRSPYDGSLVTVSTQDIVDFILQMKPHYVLLPEGFHQIGLAALNKLLEITTAFIPMDDVSNYLPEWEHGTYYVDADGSCHLTSSNGEQFIESDVWASDACMGKMYCREAVINLQESMYSTQFDLIDPHCQCPTCQQKFTRAYLHHLLKNTPLLCQRLLVQHNMYTLHCKIMDFL